MGFLSGYPGAALWAHGPKISQFVHDALERTETDDGRMSHLDGLRALALIGVLLFHFGGLLPGGFLGVDMFFVLSGFLMTRAILTQVQTNSYSFRRFVHTRALRICPSLYTVLLLTVVSSVYVLPRPLLSRVCTIAPAASVFLANLKFMSESGYHDASSITKPLLHTWSLAVEGQFYILWSCVALLRSVVPICVCMGLLCIASVLYHLFAAGNDTALFFLMPSRLYQFGAGAIAVFAYNSLPPLASSIASLIGIASVATSMCFVSPEHGPMFVFSLPVIFGTMLLIVTPRGVLNGTHGLSNPCVRYIGHVSYSAYLLHWPAIVLTSFMMPGKSGHLLLAALVTFVLSPALYYNVEERFRMRKSNVRVGEGIWFTAILLASVLVYGAALSRVADALVLQTAHENTGQPDTFSLHTSEWYRDELRTMEKEMRNAGGPIVREKPQMPYAVITGDSFARHLLVVINKTSETSGYPSQFAYISRPACIPCVADLSMLASRVTKDRASYENACESGGANLEAVLAHRRPERMILVGRWQDYVESERAMERLSTGLAATIPRVRRLAMLGILPHPDSNNILHCLWRQVDGLEVSPTAHEKCPQYFNVSRKTAAADKVLQRFISRKHPDVIYISVLSSNLCRAGLAGKTECKAWDREKGPFFYDEMGHMTVVGSREAASGVFSFLSIGR